MSEARPERRFPTTHWSIIARLKSSDAKEAQNAVQEVFTTYRYPLYGYLRTSGLHHEDAEDVLQGFFEKMLRNDSLGDANRERGKLRTFLLTALSRFKLNIQRSEQRRHQRVNAEADLWDEDEARYQRERHATHDTPETYFDRRWAVELIGRVRARLKADYDKRGKQALHEALAPLISSAEAETESFNATATRLGVTENALRISLHRLRGDFRDLLLTEVKRTLDEGEDVKAEIQYLLGLFE
jgi:DNA-directed RNA polymerase specialized sigma24 family protein